jgi:hypothetical protein
VLLDGMGCAPRERRSADRHHHASQRPLCHQGAPPIRRPCGEAGPASAAVSWDSPGARSGRTL